MPDRDDEFPPSPLASDLALPLGYVTHPLPRALDDKGPSTRTLLLPERVKIEIDEARALEYRHRVAEMIRKDQERLQQTRANQLSEAEAEKAPDNAKEQAQADTEGTPDADTDSDPDPQEAPEHLYPVYTDATLIAFKARMALLSPDKEVRKRDEEVSKLLVAKGCKRLIGMPDSPQEAMEELRGYMLLISIQS